MPRAGFRFTTFPHTEPPPDFIPKITAVFQANAAEISTEKLAKGLTSDQVLAKLCPELLELGFDVEQGKRKADKIERPVFFGENGVPTLQYQIDAYHSHWRCGLEVEAGRAWMGNAVYRDLIQALIMVQVDHLVLAVPLAYRYRSGGRKTISRDYENTVSVATALFGHTRVRMPYGLTVVGY